MKLIYRFSLFAAKQKNFYQILEVTPQADMRDIKLKYIELVKKYHPDHNKDDPNAEEHFKEVVKAYQTLKDPIKRQLYDSDPFSFDKSGTAQSANEVNSYYYQTKKHKAYYENKWYSYNKPEYDTLHEEQSYKEHVADEFNKAILFRGMFIIVAFVLWDAYRFYARKRHDKFLKTQKQILDSEFEDSMIDNYIEERQSSQQIGL